jgi:hypothetical protein
MKDEMTNGEHTVTVGDRTYYIRPDEPRKPWLLPLPEGWDWYRFADGVYSSRWLAHGPVRVQGTTYRCTGCGRETDSFYSIRSHNHEGRCPGVRAA